MTQGKLIIFSAPSGAGKTTIVKHLLKKFPTLSFSISATTRESRGDEEHEKDYYFISKEDFLHKVAHQEFVEFEECLINYIGLQKKKQLTYPRKSKA